MLSSWFILLVSLSYLCLLFAIAYYGDKRADEGRSFAANPYVYTLSIAVFCTSWTFYGSVGRAATDGIGFLPVYLGPTLTFALWWFVLHKIIRITKAHNITSIADFISARYGKSNLLSGLVTVIAVVGIMPYISLQLKAISTSFAVLLQYQDVAETSGVTDLSSLLELLNFSTVPVLRDTAFLVTLVLAIFSILFGTRHIDASERHEGMVLAIAFESVIKLLAFLAVGIFVTYGLYDGFGDLFGQARAMPDLNPLFTQGTAGGYGAWVSTTLLSMAAVICLPRQFQVTVVENVDEGHLRKAVWLFPLYLLAINIFVLPIALSGVMMFTPGGSNLADMFVLTIPLAENQGSLALFVFIGGLSAASGMVIVATIALSTMVCNDLIMPVLLRIKRLKLNERGDLTRLLLGIRRGSILVILLLSYSYFRFIGESYTLTSIGLVSFAAAAQFAPAIIGGIFWKGGTRKGALTGLVLGFLVWTYTLVLPSFARSGWLPIDFVDFGPAGIELLKPYALFGLQDFDTLSHSLFWSMLANIGGYVAVSLLSRQNALERIQAALFVDVFQHSGLRDGHQLWRGTATYSELYNLVSRFVGERRSLRAFQSYARSRGLNLMRIGEADSDLVNFAERLLAGTIGAATARALIGTVVKGEIVSIEEVMEVLGEASEAIKYSHQLEEKSRELEAATAELRAANERLQELDRLKDDFLTTVSHELRTPLTSIRSFSEILYDHPKLAHEERTRFLGIVIKESERLTRLINQILDMAKLESGRTHWNITDVDAAEAIREAVAANSSLLTEDKIELSLKLPDDLQPIRADQDRFIQVMVNLLANAVKSCSSNDPWVEVRVIAQNEGLKISVADNGPGVPLGSEEHIFDKFQQVNDSRAGATGGTGLGLPICRQIVEYLGGRIWLERPDENEAGSGQEETRAEVGGAVFSFTLPYGKGHELDVSDGAHSAGEEKAGSDRQAAPADLPKPGVSVGSD
ncbi:sensor histidine kinase [Denitrobaculum tricleocarpae]|uniref:histidine kinase n=1 Tax=Denitrobaculum tricleocarpae TaxID=2591009 RepID=A0A545TMH9_9PROT|nr:sensor histidine kinase [Denitrobaculum tricleocarpae]TQV78414.1 histidine kinase [Denitrobaculum tricleocarpae]